MNQDDYIAQSERTEKKFPDGMQLSAQMTSATVSLLVAHAHICQALDIIKKQVIYGKWDNELEALVQIDSLVKKSGENVNELPVFPDFVLTQQHAELLHALLGDITESGERNEAINKHIFGNHELDVVNLGEEIGDSRWYEAIYFRLFGLDPQKICQQNIDKLKARYPDKFDAERAVNRNVEEERAILED